MIPYQSSLSGAVQRLATYCVEYQCTSTSTSTHVPCLLHLFDPPGVLARRRQLQILDVIPFAGYTVKLCRCPFYAAVKLGRAYTVEHCRVKTKSAKFPNTDALLTSTTAASANTPPRLSMLLFKGRAMNSRLLSGMLPFQSGTMY